MKKSINRRRLLKNIGLTALGAGISPLILAKSEQQTLPDAIDNTDREIRDYLEKIRNFNQNHKDDIWIDNELYPVFKSLVHRLRRLQKLVGYGNFNILNFTDALSYARNYPVVGAFSREELGFMEMVFYEEGKRYGFLGHKPLKEITDKVNSKQIVKVPYSGHFLYREKSIEIYDTIRKELGDKVILTSGIRGVMKQFLLFLNKAYTHSGNLSLASRSLAPPGYSFHGNGDFDVGQVGYGYDNFTERFTETEVFKRLSDMGYLKLRYPQDNQLGVRYEPWHIKINV